jgi:hypothetical protein
VGVIRVEVITQAQRVEGLGLLEGVEERIWGRIEFKGQKIHILFMQVMWSTMDESYGQHWETNGKVERPKNW